MFNELKIIFFRYVDISDVLIREARLPRKYRVCDNVDLEIILTEYENYYKMKFQKYFEPQSGKLFRQLPRGITLAYDLCLGHSREH